MGKKKYAHRKQFTYNGVVCDLAADTEIELGEKIANKKRAIDGDERIIRGTSTVKQWAKVYLETYRQPACGEKQYSDLCSINSVWIVPYIGSMAIRDVRRVNCQKILNAMQGLSKTHITKVKQFLFSMFDVAVDEDPPLIARNPARKLKLPQATSGSRRALTAEERQIFATLFESHCRGCWPEFLLMFGPRPHETERIYGRHIDLAGNRLFIDGTKSKASNRWVPIRDDISDRLRKFLAEASREPFMPVFRQRNGSPIKKATRRRWWESLKNAYEKELNRNTPDHLWQKFPVDLVPYCFRHTYSTDLTGFGVPLEIKAQYLGHKPDVTEIYTHHSDAAFELGRKMINKGTKKKDVEMTRSAHRNQGDR
jgi:integrase